MGPGQGPVGLFSAATPGPLFGGGGCRCHSLHIPFPGLQLGVLLGRCRGSDDRSCRLTRKAEAADEFCTDSQVSGRALARVGRMRAALGARLGPLVCVSLTLPGPPSSHLASASSCPRLRTWGAGGFCSHSPPCLCFRTMKGCGGGGQVLSNPIIFLEIKLEASQSFSGAPY